MGYTQQVVHGVSWVGAFRVVTRIVAFVRIAIIARILNPSQFGIVSIALLVLSLIEIITETGINVFLVQQDKKIDSYINTAWVVSIIRGVIIAAMMVLGAGIIASFFNSPDAEGLIMTLSLVPLIRGFISPSIVYFQKELQFNKEFYFRTLLFTVDAVVSIILAFVTRNPVSLIYGIIFSAVLEVIISFFIVKPKPVFAYKIEQVREIIGRGKWITGASLSNYLYQNVDDIVVGKLLGTSSLGLYDVAYRISMLPITEISDTLSKVTFPVYVKISGDMERLKKAFFKTIGITTILVVPIGIIFLIFPEQIIRVLLGDMWIEASSALRILAVVGVMKALVGSTTALFFAAKKQEYVNWILFVSVVGLSFGVLPLTQKYGIVGAAYASVIGIVLSIPLAIYFILKIFKK